MVPPVMKGHGSHLFLLQWKTSGMEGWGGGSLEEKELVNLIVGCRLFKRLSVKTTHSQIRVKYNFA